MPFCDGDGDIIEGNADDRECYANWLGGSLDGEVLEFGTRSAVAEEEGTRCIAGGRAHGDNALN